jgi:hypothetical protein
MVRCLLVLGRLKVYVIHCSGWHFIVIPYSYSTSYSSAIGTGCGVKSSDILSSLRLADFYKDI